MDNVEVGLTPQMSVALTPTTVAAVADGGSGTALGFFLVVFVFGTVVLVYEMLLQLLKFKGSASAGQGSAWEGGAAWKGWKKGGMGPGKGWQWQGASEGRDR